MAKGDKPSPGGLGEALAPHYLGHRERARQKFLAIGADALQDYELLELVLQIVIPRKDTMGLAKDLLARFGSFSAVLGAPPARLAEVKGLGEISGTSLKILQAAAQRFARDRVAPDLPILGSWSALIDYCHSQMAFNDVEQTASCAKSLI